jgi:uncharacterized membrane protein YfcA
VAVWNLFFSSVLLPLVVTAVLWRTPRRPPGRWAGSLVMASGVIGFSVLAAPWGWFGFPLRIVLAVLFIAAAVSSFRRPLIDEPKPESPVAFLVKIVIALFFGSVAAGVLRAHSVPPGALALQFPLRNGTYLVEHGGSDPAATIYGQDAARRFSVDVVKLNAAGMRATGIYPAELTRYAIFDVPVLSPCTGTALTAVDGLPDHTGAADEKPPAGNQVVLRCGDANVVLAHLRQGTVAIHAGAPIAAGTVLGRVGNSGSSGEPHLHIHAERKGIAVPILFDGRWLVRNALVRR